MLLVSLEYFCDNVKQVIQGLHQKKRTVADYSVSLLRVR